MKNKPQSTGNIKSEKFVNAVLNGKNLKAQKMLEDIIKEKAVKRIQTVLDN